MTATVLSYNYAAQSNQPPSGNCNQSQSTPELISFSYTDNNGVDQTAFLQSIVVDDQIACNGITWFVTAILLKGSNVQFTVDPGETAPPYGVNDFTFGEITTTGEQYTITDADLGNMIATNGNLKSIQFVTPQSSDPHDSFTLVDGSIGETPLFSFHPALNGFPPGTVFPMHYHPFGNLKVKEIPVGSSFIIEYDTQ
jgi:hypothetical protein